MVRSESDSETLRQAVAERLKIEMDDAGLETVDEFAKLVQASRSAASNWLQGYYLFPVQHALILKEHRPVTLDWIYGGDRSGLSTAGPYKRPKLELDADAFRAAVAWRLKIIMDDAGLKTVEELAHHLEATRSAASNWLQGYYLLPVEHALILKGLTNIPLDWIYGADNRGLTVGTYVRLSARLAGLDPPRIPQEPPADLLAQEKEAAAVRRSDTRKPSPAAAASAGAKAKQAAKVPAEAPKRGKPGSR